MFLLGKQKFLYIICNLYIFLKVVEICFKKKRKNNNNTYYVNFFFKVLKHEKLEERLLLCQKSYDFPRWWQNGKHDKALLEGVAK